MKKEIGWNNIVLNQTSYNAPVKFFLYENEVFYNQEYAISGSFRDNLGSIPQGSTKVGRLNLDSPELAYPFVFKDTSRNSFKKIKKANYFNDYSSGDQINSTYPLSASISVYHYESSLGASSRKYLNPLRNPMRRYNVLSSHFAYSSSLHNRDLDSTSVTVIDIPSIFYGSQIQKGSLNLKFIVSGSVSGELNDSKRNGELIQSSGSISANNGKIAGVVLYNEGIILLTGSWDISNHTEDYLGTSQENKWIHFGTCQISSSIPSSSFEIGFKTTNEKSHLTMFLGASSGQYNFSNNSTFLSGSDYNSVWESGSFLSREPTKTIKNVVSGAYLEDEADFEATTYISEVFIHDEDGSVIMKGKLGKPLRKRQTDDFTLKLRYDL